MSSKAPYDATGIEFFDIPDFQFSNGHRQPIKLAYRSFNPAGTKGTVLIPTCYGGRINSTLNFTTGALQDYQVIVVAMLGNGESSSPSNDPAFPLTKPGPSVQYEDDVHAQYQLVTERFGLQQLEAVIGFSMGGQQAYYWSVMHGSGPAPFLKNAVVICSSAKTSGHNYAFLEGPISALEVAGDYAGGAYRTHGTKPREGLRAFGRAYAGWLTSAEWFRQELWRKLGAASLQDWLHPEVAGYESWDAENLLALARKWQGGDIGKVGGGGQGYEKALQGIQARVLLMPSMTDQYFWWRDSEREMEHLQHGVFRPIDTAWGHIAGGGANPVDAKWIDGEIATFLKG
ncbi:homoserine acetyltransferase like protein [Coleophoma cylindrospora]|uniref:Homoserine acetyltransferase like protein n=1 Tax=Coleophoma cylindrospora TaxID=1849047 RepID=A0A3D8S720_9HELO|nr:homoserine acetyltransferase like protein [Coleophoma cylindrospora]